MKKKLCLMILSVLVLPLFALFGCGDVASYGVTVYTSDGVYGTVTGDGTYSEGSTVTLTATPKGNGVFVSWVYQGSTELKTDSTYTITAPSDVSKKSTLTFKASQATKGSYTAVFDEQGKTEDNKIMYIKLDSYRLTTLDPTTHNGTTNSENLKPTMTNVNMNVYHGKTANSLVEVAKLADVSLLHDFINTTSNINQVLNLSTYSSQHIYVQFSGKIGETTISKDFHTNVTYKTSSQEAQNATYSSKVNYSTDGTYQIVFKFSSNAIGPTTTYYLVVNYKNLSVSNTLTA